MHLQLIPLHVAAEMDNLNGDTCREIVEKMSIWMQVKDHPKDHEARNFSQRRQLYQHHVMEMYHIIGFHHRKPKNRRNR